MDLPDIERIILRAHIRFEINGTQFRVIHCGLVIVMVAHHIECRTFQSCSDIHIIVISSHEIINQVAKFY